jgi:prophage regulatory protein
MTAQVYLSVIQVAERLGVSRDSIYRWKRLADFPKAYKLSAGSSRWRLVDIEAWEAKLDAAFATHLSFAPSLQATA